MAMYCAVHSPIPRIERSLAIASSKVWLNLFHRASERVRRDLDDNESAQKRSQKEQDAQKSARSSSNAC
jgi:hypothetical protein